MKELQALALQEHIKEEAPRAEVDLIPLGGDRYVCRLGTRQHPYFLWNLTDWDAIKGIRFGVREKVSVEV